MELKQTTAIKYDKAVELDFNRTRWNWNFLNK